MNHTLVRLMMYAFALFAAACLQKQKPDEISDTRDPVETASYHSDTASLLYKNKKFLTIDTDADSINSIIPFTRKQDGLYISMDKYYSAKLSTGTIAGVLLFSTDAKNNLSQFSASWRIKGDMVDTAGMELIDYIDKQYLSLPNTFFKVKTFTGSYIRTLSKKLTFSHPPIARTLTMRMCRIGF